MSKIKELMHDSTNFYFDSVNQTIMDTWSKGRVVLVGDAGYSVSLSLGQSTSVAIVGSYVLAGELAEHWADLPKSFANYESELRDYVVTNQQMAFDTSTAPQQSLVDTSEAGTTIDANTLPDFGQSVIPLTLKNYH